MTTICIIAALAYAGLTAFIWAVMSGRITLKHTARDLDDEGGDQ